MTDKEMADKVYLEPLKEEVIKNIIKIEKPDSILVCFLLYNVATINLLFYLS